MNGLEPYSANTLMEIEINKRPAYSLHKLQVDAGRSIRFKADEQHGEGLRKNYQRRFRSDLTTSLAGTGFPLFVARLCHTVQGRPAGIPVLHPKEREKNHPCTYPPCARSSTRYI